MNDEQEDTPDCCLFPPGNPTIDSSLTQLHSLGSKTLDRLLAIEQAYRYLRPLSSSIALGSKECIALDLSRLLPVLDKNDWLFDTLGKETTEIIFNLIQETGLKELKNGHACPAGGPTDV